MRYLPQRLSVLLCSPPSCLGLRLEVPRQSCQRRTAPCAPADGLNLMTHASYSTPSPPRVVGRCRLARLTSLCLPRTPRLTLANPCCADSSKAKAAKAAKAVKKGVFKKQLKPRYSVVFHRPKTLKKARDPKYPRIRCVDGLLLDHSAARVHVGRASAVIFGHHTGRVQPLTPCELCRCSAPSAQKLDEFAVVKFPLTTESAMKKIEDNNTLVSCLTRALRHTAVIKAERHDTDMFFLRVTQLRC